MAYTLDFAVNLGISQTGFTLTAQLVDTAGANVGSLISTGFTEIGAGNYLWHATAIPSGHRGGVIFKSGATIMAFTAINPEEAENMDVKTSSVTGSAITAGPLPASREGVAIFVRRGDTLILSTTGLGSLVGRTKLWFTVKDDTNAADTLAVIQILETGGLVRLNGAAATAGDGSLVVTDADLGNVTITLAATASAALAVSLVRSTWDIQRLVGTVVTTLATGSFTVAADATRSTS